MKNLKEIYNAVASCYDVQHGLMTAGTDEATRRWLVRHTVRRDDQVLDAGGGTGRTAQMAAVVAGADGQVTCMDFSPAMLEQARKKAEASGLAKYITFREGDIYQLPFEDGQFDVVLTTFSLCPLEAPANGALELYRVVKPGGVLGAAHSTEPNHPALNRIYHHSESWLNRNLPQVSLGCRAVSVLPALQKAGALLLQQQRLGLPIAPFFAFVVQKPDNGQLQQ